MPESAPAEPALSTRRLWVGLVSNAVLSCFAVVWLVTGTTWALLVWESVAALYLIGGFALHWRGQTERVGSRAMARVIARLSWFLPLASGAVGAYSAVVALISRSASTQSGERLTVTIAAAIAVVLSWALVNIGFAEVYQALDEAEGDDGIEFPGAKSFAFLNYVYFSFTIGSAFATSDARIRAFSLRRVVLLQTAVSFLYNALIVASAVEVLRGLIRV